jgi:hypothetical protein
MQTATTVQRRDVDSAVVTDLFSGYLMVHFQLVG